MAIKVNEKEIPGTVLEAKRWWRSELIRQVPEMSDLYMFEASNAIRSKFIRTEAFKNAKTIMLFASADREVITLSMLTTTLLRGKRVCLPRCLGKNENGEHIMEAREFGHGAKLTEGAYGIPEPGEEALVVEPGEIDLVVAPCVACDVECRRLGHGAGYYDRFLKDVRDDCGKIAFCYEKLIVEKLPSEAHDVIMDAVITEENIYEKR